MKRRTLIGAFTASAALMACERRGDILAEAEAEREAQSLLAVAERTGEVDTFIDAIRTSGLDGALAGPGPFTVFAPSDQAFADLPPDLVSVLSEPEQRPLLATLLAYHVVIGQLATRDMPEGTAILATLQGERLRLNNPPVPLDADAPPGTGAVTVEGANLILRDVQAANGIIHVIDKVLLPPGRAT